MSGATGRQLLKTELEARTTTDFLIYTDGQDRDTIGRPTILIQRARIEPYPAAPKAFRLNRYRLMVISPTAVGPTAEDILDDLADEVADAIRDIPNADFEYAERFTYDSTNPAYDLFVVLADDRQKEA
jgi:hypothetical protein